MQTRSLYKLAAAVVALSLTGIIPFAFGRHDSIREKQLYISQPMIGCLKGDGKLEETLERFASGSGFKITFVNGFDKSLIHKQCAAFVIDKPHAKKGGCVEYANFLKSYQSDTPLMVVDNMKDLIRDNMTAIYELSTVEIPEFIKMKKWCPLHDSNMRHQV